MAFPTLEIPKTAQPGSVVNLEFTPKQGKASDSLFVAFISGLDTKFVSLHKGQKRVKIPEMLRGVVFAAVTNVGHGMVDDSNTIAGPAFLSFGFDSQGALVTAKQMQ